MREIIVRGKVISEDCSGEWVVGVLLPGSNEILWPHPDVQDGYLSEEVDLETVGQFTGVTDIFGKKVWEGDIVEYSNPFDYTLENHIGVVEYCDEDACFRVFDGVVKHLLGYLGCETGGLRVVGNRWDNPELLMEIYK